MEQRLISLVHQHTPRTKLGRSAGSVAALRLLTAPYFQGRLDEHWMLCHTSDGYKQPVGENIDLTQRWRDEVLFRAPGQLYDSFWGRETFGSVKVEGIPASVERSANRILNKIKQADPDLLGMLFNPTDSQIQRRYEMVIEVVQTLDLDERLAEMLGPDYYLDGNLRTQGHEYHTSPSYNDKKGFYILAHNSEEVGGILHLSDYRDWTYGINYLSVAPSFRRLGLAGRMFEKAIEMCKSNDRVLVRTAPGEFASERPAIPDHFDRLCVAAPILHVQANSTLMSHVGRALERLDYHQVLRSFKPVCDQFATGENRDMWHQPELNNVLAALASTIPEPAKRMKP